MSGVYQPYSRRISVVCQPYISRYMSAVYQPYINRMSAVYQPYIRCIFAVCQPYLRCMSTVCQPYLISQFSDYTMVTINRSNRSYYDLYNVILPESVPLSLHLPTHLTTLSPVRPLPPPVVPSVWLPWLQAHYHVACLGGVVRFLDRQSEIPGVEGLRSVLKVYWFLVMRLNLSVRLLGIVFSSSLDNSIGFQICWALI